MSRMLVIVAVALSVVAAGAEAAGRRVALVIGNAAYQNAATLKNPINDARAISDALTRIGFKIVLGTDLDRSGMEQKIRAFGREADGADIAVVYYSGHGIQVAGQNYLLPVTAKLEREQDLRFEAIKLDDVMEEANGAKQLRLFLFDACRDNPFKTRLEAAMGTRSMAVGRGLARIEPTQSDTLIAYATREDNVAQDGSGDNSPFTQALLKYIEQPGLEVRLLFGHVRDEVRQNTQGRQEPALYGSLGGNAIYLTITVVPPPAPAPQPTPTVLGIDPKQVELAFWDSIKSSTMVADFQAYLDKYPKGDFATLARNRLMALGMPKPPTPAPTPAPTPTPPPAAAPSPGLSPDEALRRGDEAYNRQDYAEAMRLYRIAADAGDPVGQGDVGYLYGKGLGVAQDDAEAVRWYRKSAEQGNSTSQYNLALRYESGTGVAKDPAQARRWMTKAAAGGDGDAETWLANHPEPPPAPVAPSPAEANRKGDEAYNRKDYAEALKWYRQAAEAGYAAAQGNLGFLYAKGFGVPVDPAEAVRWYRLSAEQGNVVAQYNLGLKYEAGLGVAKDLDQARAWMQKAAASGDRDAKQWLSSHPEPKLSAADMNRKGDDFYNKQDYAEAMRWYRQAAAQGYATAEGNVGYLYSQGLGVAQDHAEAIRWYNMAAAKGEPASTYNLGLKYAAGEGVPKDMAEARSWMEKAAALNHANAKKWLVEHPADSSMSASDMNHKGDEFYDKKDYVTAMRWYRQAAALGYATAEGNVGYLYSQGFGVKQDHGEAIRWYKMAAAQGEPASTYNLGLKYAAGEGVAKDMAEARTWMEKAAALNHENAKKWLVDHPVDASMPPSEMNRKGDEFYDKKDYVAAMRWYRQAADQGYASAQGNVGYLYAKGLGVPQNHAEAVRWYRKSADQGNATSAYNLALKYESGQGVSKDLVQTRYWMQKAADGGDEDAKKWLSSH